MKIQLKKLVETKWHPVELNLLEGKSIVSFMAASEEILFATLWEDEAKEPFLAVSNRQEIVDKYQGKVLTLHVCMMIELLGAVPYPPIALNVLSDGAFIEHRYQMPVVQSSSP